MAGQPPAPWETPGQRQNPQQPAYPQSYAPQPGAYPQHQGAYAQQPAGHPANQSPYGSAGYPPQYGAYAPPKPTSGMAVASLVCLAAGLVVLVTWPLGIIFGIVGMKQTGAGGTKSGRGMALAGLIGNIAGTVIAALGIAAITAFMVSIVPKIEDDQNVRRDGRLIEERLRLYEAAHGDFSPGGPRFVNGSRNSETVTGVLSVGDLVGPHELKLPIVRYRILIDDQAATVYYRGEDGSEREVGNVSPRHRGTHFDSRWANGPPERSDE